MKVIFHIDMTAFFASCHEVENPELKNKAIVISNISSKRSIISTANYKAREYGIKSAMPLYQAKQLCSNLIIIKPDFALYYQYSQKIFEIIQKFSPLIEISSIDECFLDVTNNYLKYGSTKKMAQKIQNSILQQLSLQCTIGISKNKFLAKMASNIAKPGEIIIIRQKDIYNRIWTLPINEMYGIGKKTAIKLNNINIKTIGEIANISDIDILQPIFGRKSLTFKQLANGQGDDKIIIDITNIKHISNEITLDNDTNDEQEIKEYLLRLSQKVTLRAKNRKIISKTIVCGLKLQNKQKISKQQTISHFTNDVDIIYSNILILFEKLWNKQLVRNIKVGITNNVYEYNLTKQLNLFNIYKKDYLNINNNFQKLISEINIKNNSEIIITGQRFLEKYNNKK